MAAPLPDRSSQRPEGPADSQIAIALIAGIVLMFLIGFILLVVSMASDWQ